MGDKSKIDRRSGRVGCRWVLILVVAFLALGFSSVAAAPDIQATLDVSKASPRAVEPLTERSILRDYKFAWVNLAQALASSSTDPLNGLFEGSARQWLIDAVINERSSGLTTRYMNQSHKLEVVFYAPEGDVMELHDTAQCDLEILDGDKSVHTEHAVARYVVLMTPGADRWVVRQLQSVPEF